MSESEVERINDAMTLTLMPAIVLVCIFMIIGLIGNPLVIYYYGFRSRTTSSFHFILALAVFDLIVCCVSMPLEIVDMTHFYKFESVAACKILRFINYFAAIGSGGILLALAIDRYRKICRPLRKQLTLHVTRVIIAIVCVFSFCISWPSLVFYNIVSVNITKSPGLTGSDCTMIREEDYKLLITIYNAVLFLCFFVGVTSLIVLYSLVGRTLFHISCCAKNQYISNHVSDKRRYSPADTIVSEIDGGSKRNSVSYGLEIQIKDEFDNKPLATITELNIDNNNQTNRPRPISANIEDKDIEMKTLNENKRNSTQFDETCYLENDGKSSDDVDEAFNRLSTEIILQEGPDGKTVAALKNGRSQKKRKTVEKIPKNMSENSLNISARSSRQPRKSISKRLNTRQYTLMMIAITIAFIVSFLPYLALVTWRTIATDYEVDVLSDSELVVFQIFIRSFLISSAVNPMIYGFLNTDFRKFLFRRLCCCCGGGASSSPDISSSHSI